uniref:Conotoxin superfamily I4 n=1 Tax=Conus ermineus TaxID=55423 RepID=A0A346CJ34_CONER|nr:conotoxin precursor superfamily I4 [Conus ermineus]
MVKMFRPTYFSFLLLSVLLLGMMSMVVCDCSDNYGPVCGENDSCECSRYICCPMSNAKPKQCMTEGSCKHASDRRETIQTRDEFISALYGREEQ